MRWPSKSLFWLAALVVCACPAAAQPQLFFDAADVPDLRAKATREPFASMVTAIQSRLDPLAGVGETERQQAYSWSTEARNAANMFILTGDVSYADRAREMAVATVGLSLWDDSGDRSLTRAAAGAGVAQAYDLCKSEWDAATRDDISTALIDNAQALMAGGGSGWPGDNAKANNWHAARYSSAILAYLASDETGYDTQINTAWNNVLTHFEANLAGNTSKRDDGKGWNPEGLGYTQWPVNRSWGQMAVAMQRLKGRDLIAEGPPGLAYTTWTAFVATVPMERLDGRLGAAPDFSDDGNGVPGRGLPGLAFSHAPAELLPRLKWQYDRIWGAQGDGSYDTDDGAGLWSYLYYPEAVVAQNPADVWGLHYLDEHFAMVMFRDRYQDENDLVTMHSARWRNANGVLENTHWGPDVNGIRIVGLNSYWATSGRNNAENQTSVMPIAPESIGHINPDRQTGSVGFGNLDEYYLHSDDGSGYSVVSGTDMGSSESPVPEGTVNHVRRFAVDYSELSGARAVFVVADRSDNGSYWRWNTGGMNTVTLDPPGGTFTITSPDGHQLIGYVLHGDGSTLRQGVASRNRPLELDGVVWTHNDWVDFQSADGDFLVLMQMVEAGQSPATWSAAGSGMSRTIRIGEQVFHVETDRVWATNWNHWTGGSGQWSNAANWKFGAAGGEGAWAVFGRDSAAASTVTADAATTIGHLRFEGDHGIAVTGAGTLTFEAIGTQARIETSGSVAHQIDNAITLVDDLLIRTEAGAALALHGPIDTAGHALQIEGDGQLQLIATVTGNVVNAGLLRPGDGLGGVTVDGDFVHETGGVLLIGLDQQTGAMLTVNGNASLAGGLRVAIDGGTWQAGDQVLLVDAASLAGQFALTGAAAPAVDGSDLNYALTYDPLTGEVLLSLLYAGDLDGDEDVSFVEAATVVSNIGLTGASVGDGDLDGDGVIEVFEAELAVGQYNRLHAASPGFVSLQVPEPAAFVLLAVLLPLYGCRPRRRVG